MSTNSKIQWCDHTWNIARGCSKVDEDCKFCYMYRESLGGHRYDPKTVVRTKTVFNMPLKIKPGQSQMWEGPQLVFTSSLTDWGHQLIDPYRNEMFDIIKRRPDLIFQMLTKRPERLDGMFPDDHWFGNVWLGTSIGSPEAVTRAFTLAHTPVPVRLKFLSIEPLHSGPLKLYHIFNTKQIKWVIVGGESGNENGMYRYRECKLEWIESIIEQCQQFGIPVFVKQMGTHLSKKLGLNERHGGDINEWPAHLRIRQFPRV